MIRFKFYTIFFICFRVIFYQLASNSAFLIRFFLLIGADSQSPLHVEQSCHQSKAKRFMVLQGKIGT